MSSITSQLYKAARASATGRSIVRGRPVQRIVRRKVAKTVFKLIGW